MCSIHPLNFATGHEADPELSQNGIDFVTRLLNKRPITLLRLEPSNAAEFFFLFTLEVLDGKEPLPKTSAAEFWVRRTNPISGFTHI